MLMLIGNPVFTGSVVVWQPCTVTTVGIKPLDLQVLVLSGNSALWPLLVLNPLNLQVLVLSDNPAQWPLLVLNPEFTGSDVVWRPCTVTTAGI